MNLKHHLNKLHYFAIAVESDSLSKAAQVALISQPQLSKVIQQLEDILEAQLLVRSKKGIKPTQSGLKLYQFAKEVLSKSDNFEFLIRSKQEEMSGNIRIGAYDSISRYFLPDFVKYMKSAMPELKLSIYSHRSSEIIDEILAERLDFGVVVGKSREESRLRFNHIYDDYFECYQIPDLNLKFQKNLILFKGAVKETDELINKFKPEVIHECENLETVMSLTLSGLGVGILPTRVARENILSARVVMNSLCSESKISEHGIYIVHKDQSEAFTKSVLEELTRFLRV